LHSAVNAKMYLTRLAVGCRVHEDVPVQYSAPLQKYMTTYWQSYSCKWLDGQKILNSTTGQT